MRSLPARGDDDQSGDWMQALLLLETVDLNPKRPVGHLKMLRTRNCNCFVVQLVQRCRAEIPNLRQRRKSYLGQIDFNRYSVLAMDDARIAERESLNRSLALR